MRSVAAKTRLTAGRASIYIRQFLFFYNLYI
ncbi:hypothetical protein FHX06_004605 [Rhizobium sp. BK512]|nr:hypothetical protein [Rhizobium sp. BK512]